jgi:hypothetical protein
MKLQWGDSQSNRGWHHVFGVDCSALIIARGLLAVNTPILFHQFLVITGRSFLLLEMCIERRKPA